MQTIQSTLKESHQEACIKFDEDAQEDLFFNCFQRTCFELIRKYVLNSSKPWMSWDADDRGLIYEILCALYFRDLRLVLWSFLPPWWNVWRKDMGTDAPNMERTIGAQMKCYGENSSITYKHICTFIISSKVNLPNLKRRLLITTSCAKINSYAQQTIDCYDIEVIRKDVPELLQFVKTTVAPSIQRLLLEEQQEEEYTEIVPRDYQETALQIISTSTKPIIKIQKPPQTGKGIMTAIQIIRDKEKYGFSNNLIVVERRFLARQHQRMFLKKFKGLKVGFIGDGVPINVDVLKTKDIIVLIAQSFPHLKKILKHFNFRNVIMDEFHHFELKGVRAQPIFNIPSVKKIALSATFRDQSDLQFNYSLVEAIESGYLVDYKMHFAVMSDGNRFKASAKYYAANRMLLGPGLLVVNKREHGIQVCEFLRKEGLNAAIFDGNTKDGVRRRILKDMESGKLDAIVVVGCLNEGITIRNLHTVFFVEHRDSPINKIQVSFRASNTHPSKPFSNIVMAVGRTDFENKDMSKFVRHFMKRDPRLKKALKSRGRSARVVVSIQGEDDIPDAEFLYSQMYDSCGNMCGRSSLEERALEFRDYVDDNGFVSQRNKDARFEDGALMGMWFSQTILQNTSNLEQVRSILEESPIIKEKIFMNESSPEKYFLYKLNQFLTHVRTTEEFPKQTGDHKQLYEWFKTNVFQKEDNLKKVKLLLTDKDTIVQQRIEAYETKKEKPKMLFNEKLEYLREWIIKNEQIPISEKEKFKKDGTDMYKWFYLQVLKKPANLKKVEDLLTEKESPFLGLK